jgi:hypothetical protein
MDRAKAEMAGLLRAAEERQRERQRERRRQVPEWQEPELGAEDAFDKELRDTARRVDGADDLSARQIASPTTSSALRPRSPNGASAT